jgi:tetratricopeptide (TPR) repeat protein
VRPRDRILRFAAPAILLAAFVLALREAGDILRAQRLVRAVEARTLLMMRSGQLQRPLLLAHVAALADAKRLDPAEVAARVATGSEYLLLGDYAKARAAYEEALALEPRPEIYLNLGKAWLGENEPARAREQFARALKGDPNLAREIPADLAAASDPLRGENDPDGAQQDR